MVDPKLEARTFDRICLMSELRTEVLENALKLEGFQEAKASDYRKKAVVGSFEYNKRIVRDEYLGEDWARIARALREEGGAVAHPRYDRVFINTDIWSGNHKEPILEHEIIERLFGNSVRTAREKLDRLGLVKDLGEYYRTPKYAHYLAVVFELAKAKELGILEDHLALHHQVAENADMSEGRRKFDQVFRERVVGMLIGNN